MFRGRGGELSIDHDSIGTRLGLGLAGGDPHTLDSLARPRVKVSGGTGRPCRYGDGANRNATGNWPVSPGSVADDASVPLAV